MLNCLVVSGVCFSEQGMLLAWNFNQYEGFQSFSMAGQLDPNASMASWGVAYSLGPGANRCCTSQLT